MEPAVVARNADRSNIYTQVHESQTRFGGMEPAFARNADGSRPAKFTWSGYQRPKLGREERCREH